MSFPNGLLVEPKFYDTPIPLVVVEGFLSSTGAIGWAILEKQLSGYKQLLGIRRVIIASVGPVSSLHDRACELYFAIRGGRVDYGEEHAQNFFHGRYGRIHHTGLYPQWSTSNPLHFLGHSIGGSTIVKLSSLLASGFFGPDTHPDMILSITTVSAPFRGTQLVYTLGERLDAAPAVRSYSIGSILARGVHVLSYFFPALPKTFDLHTDARSLSFRETTFTSFLHQLWKSDWAEGKDATPYDVTFEAADNRESDGEGYCNPATYYKSYVAHITRRVALEKPTHKPPLRLLLSLPLYLSARAIGCFDFSALRPSPPFFPCSGPHSDVEQAPSIVYEKELGEEYWENDGVVPVFSQWHPRDCRSTRCVHFESQGPHTSGAAAYAPSCEALQPGMWHVQSLADTHHLSLLPFWLGTARQRAFWEEVNSFMNVVDDQRRQY